MATIARAAISSTREKPGGAFVGPKRELSEMSLRILTLSRWPSGIRLDAPNRAWGRQLRSWDVSGWRNPRAKDPDEAQGETR